MHKECLGGIAGSWILGLGIYAYFQSLFQVCAFIHKGVTLSVSMSHDRNSCVVHTVSDKSVGTTRDKKIHIFLSLQKHIHLLMALNAHDPG